MGPSAASKPSSTAVKTVWHDLHHLACSGMCKGVNTLMQHPQQLNAHESNAASRHLLCSGSIYSTCILWLGLRAEAAGCLSSGPLLLTKEFSNQPRMVRACAHARWIPTRITCLWRHPGRSWTAPGPQTAAVPAQPHTLRHHDIRPSICQASGYGAHQFSNTRRWAVVHAMLLADLDRRQAGCTVCLSNMRRIPSGLLVYVGVKVRVLWLKVC